MTQRHYYSHLMRGSSHPTWDSLMQILGLRAHARSVSIEMLLLPTWPSEPTRKQAASPRGSRMPTRTRPPSMRGAVLLSRLSSHSGSATLTEIACSTPSACEWRGTIKDMKTRPAPGRLGGVIREKRPPGSTSQPGKGGACPRLQADRHLSIARNSWQHTHFVSLKVSDSQDPMAAYGRMPIESIIDGGPLNIDGARLAVWGLSLIVVFLQTS